MFAEQFLRAFAPIDTIEYQSVSVPFFKVFPYFSSSREIQKTASNGFIQNLLEPWQNEIVSSLPMLVFGICNLWFRKTTINKTQFVLCWECNHHWSLPVCISFAIKNMWNQLHCCVIRGMNEVNTWSRWRINYWFICSHFSRQIKEQWRTNKKCRRKSDLHIQRKTMNK